MALSTEQALALLLILNSAHLTAADCSAQDRVPASGSAGGRAVLPCSYTPTPGQDVEVRWEAYPDQVKSVLLIASKTPSAPIPAQWSGRVKLSDEVSSGNASLLISELRLEDTLDYLCTVWINGICVTNRNVKLTVQGPPKRVSATATTQKTSPCPTQQGNAAAQRRSYCMKPL
ncbi:CD276 antigen-like protein [Huso huso]|uniref:CD276 antigen-like protein n=1 Tax=Huso huso TaxID=61971 RepID=A0ABR0Y149_HUSHU